MDILLSLQIQDGGSGEPGADDTISVPESNPPSYPAQTIRHTLDYLVQGQTGKVRTLVGLLAQSKVGTELYIMFSDWSVFGQLYH